MYRGITFTYFFTHILSMLNIYFNIIENILILNALHGFRLYMFSLLLVYLICMYIRHTIYRKYLIFMFDVYTITWKED